MNKCAKVTFLSCSLILACSTTTWAGYTTAKSVADFDRQVAEAPYMVVAFYHEIKGEPLEKVEAEQLKQFRQVFKKVSNSSKYKARGIQFIAVNVAYGNNGAVIKQRYDVTGYPSYIILYNKRQISPSPFSFFKIGEGFLSDNVTQQRLEDFIDQTVK